MGTYVLLAISVAAPPGVTTGLAVAGTSLAGMAMGALPIFWQTTLVRLGGRRR